LTVSRAEGRAARVQIALAEATGPGAADSPVAPDVERSALLALEALLAWYPWYQVLC